MSCKDKWAEEVAARLQAQARIAPGQVDGGQRCDHEGCTSLVNLATNRCVQNNHVQGGAEDRGYPSELAGLWCAVQELLPQHPRWEADDRVVGAQRFLASFGEASLLDDATAYRQGEEHILGLLEVIAIGGEASWQDDPRVKAAKMAVGVSLEPPVSPVVQRLREAMDEDTLLREDGSVYAFGRDDQELFWENVAEAVTDSLASGEDVLVYYNVDTDNDWDTCIKVLAQYEQTPGDAQSKVTVEVWAAYMKGKENWTAAELAEGVEHLRQEAQQKLDELLARRQPSAAPATTNAISPEHVQQLLAAAQRVVNPAYYDQGRPSSGDLAALRAALDRLGSGEPQGPPTVAELLAGRERKVTKKELAQLERRVQAGQEFANQAQEVAALGRPTSPAEAAALLDRLVVLRRLQREVEGPHVPYGRTEQERARHHRQEELDGVVEQALEERLRATALPGLDSVSPYGSAQGAVDVIWTKVVAADKKLFPTERLRAVAVGLGGPIVGYVRDRQRLVGWLAARDDYLEQRSLAAYLCTLKRRSETGVGKDGVERTWQAGMRVRFADPWAPGQQEEGTVQICTFLPQDEDGKVLERWYWNYGDNAVPAAVVVQKNGIDHWIPLADLEVVEEEQERG